MLIEIESLLTKILGENLSGKWKDSVYIGEAKKGPAVTISNQGFKFMPEIMESTQPIKIDLSEKFSLEGGENTYKLKNPPMVDTLILEGSSGSLKEGVDFTLDPKKGIVTIENQKSSTTKFRATYSTQTDAIVKRIKIFAKYGIAISGDEWEELDSAAEEIVKIMISMDEEFNHQGITVKPLRGKAVLAEKEGRILEMAYLFEREMRFETIAPVISKIEIAQKPPNGKKESH
jgi:hypothetical protein